MDLKEEIIEEFDVDQEIEDKKVSSQEEVERENRRQQVISG